MHLLGGQLIGQLARGVASSFPLMPHHLMEQYTYSTWSAGWGYSSSCFRNSETGCGTTSRVRCRCIRLLLAMHTERAMGGGAIRPSLASLFTTPQHGYYVTSAPPPAAACAPASNLHPHFLAPILAAVLSHRVLSYLPLVTSPECTFLSLLSYRRLSADVDRIRV